MSNSVISKTAVIRRKYWIDEIVKISGHFGNDSTRIDAELRTEIKRDGIQAIIDHLHLCGSIPEHFGHDSSEEKLYSKYTDILLAATFSHFGLTSIVLTGRGDCADVEAVGTDYSLVADAKVFRLSRTAKNQKDFKINSMHDWKREKPHALVVCPIYQLPARTSQIYQQAIAKNVCIFTYAHLLVLVLFSNSAGQTETQKLLLNILRCTDTLNPIKDAITYWSYINNTMLKYHKSIRNIWEIEKIATVEAIKIVKEEALISLAHEREKIMQLSHEEAIRFLIHHKKIDGREKIIHSVADNGIFAIS